MRTADFEYPLPGELIAQVPAPERDQSRLLVVHRRSREIEHHLFSELPLLLRAGDVLVLNDSRVIPARLHGFNAQTGGQFELLLLEENAPKDWWAMMRPGKRARPGTRIVLRNARGVPTPIAAVVTGSNAEGHRRVLFEGTSEILNVLEDLGEVPLPPYILRQAPNVNDRERYQTIFAGPPGSVAAPTAGLHFSPGMLDHLKGVGVQLAFVTLHVGPGTFAPVKSPTVEEHLMHEERFAIPQESARLINAAKDQGRRVVSVGTTSLRTIEAVAANHSGRVVPGPGKTRIFIHPPREFKVADALLTNFHLPCSTLLMLVSAFASPGTLEGRERVLNAYAEAVRQRYRFFSYGDAMFLD